MARDEFINILKQFEKHSETTNTHYALKKDAQNWFIDATEKLEYNISQIGNQKGTTGYPRIIKKPRVGMMYLFKYMPMGKAKLKYYDKYPLVIVTDVYKNGFLALNLHYLPMKLRMELLTKLVYFLNNRSYSVTTRFKRLSYDVLIPFTRYKVALPTLKRYNMKQIRTRVIKIFADEWLLASALPVQQFMKRAESTVYAASRRRIMHARQGKYGVNKKKS